VRRLLLHVALAASLLLVLGVTLRPASGPNRLELAPWTTQQLNPVNVVGNVALFALPSALLWFLGWPLRYTVLTGFLLSLGIELLQLAVPGRTTATADVVCNTLGAAAGWLLARKYWGDRASA
jgi:VanZ like family